MGGAKHRQKGSRCEREIVQLLRSHGLSAYRVPLSGSCIGFKDDIEIRAPGRTWRLESKARGAGFVQIYRWLADADVLVLRADRQRLLAVLDLEELAKLLGAAAMTPR
jgi:hypothetical protein